jgi:hypothetical protein
VSDEVRPTRESAAEPSVSASPRARDAGRRLGGSGMASAALARATLIGRAAVTITPPAPACCWWRVRYGSWR